MNRSDLVAPAKQSSEGVVFGTGRARPVVGCLGGLFRCFVVSVPAGRGALQCAPQGYRYQSFNVLAG